MSPETIGATQEPLIDLARLERMEQELTLLRTIHHAWLAYWENTRREDACQLRETLWTALAAYDAWLVEHA